MKKIVGIELNKYPTIPPTLLADPNGVTPVKNIDVDPAKLFHHHYLDVRGYAPPNPDPVNFEYLTLFRPEEELRVIGDGLGIGTAYRRAASTFLGQAFCRLFLDAHCGIHYFAHIEDVLNRPPHKDFGGHTVTRQSKGDVPDYLCAQNSSVVYLAEAKGRVSAISFKSAEFSTWRKQFDRVIVKDSKGTPVSVKGHIVATRFATETDGPRVKSKLYAEDPASPGRQPLREAPDLGSAVMALHYSHMAAKLRQPILAAALATNTTVPLDINFPAFIWRFAGPFLTDKLFVGGYFLGFGRNPPLKLSDNQGKTIFLNADPMRLDIDPATFFGLELSVFKGICAMARQGDSAAGNVPLLQPIPLFDSGFSFLQDGSIMGSLGYFEPVGIEVF
ncbi:hypothetical protein ABWH98_16825 [Labrenzia sp. ac12]